MKKNKKENKNLVNSKNNRMKHNKGITLVALVITIIVLIILAGVSINLVLGEDGVFKKAIEAKEKTEQAAINEQTMLNSAYDKMEGMGVPKDGIWNEKEKVNTPRIEGTGLTPVIISEDGTITKVNNPEEEDWYDYTNRKWANAQSADGSLWVWIPRFAYNITHNTADNSQAGSIDVVFLKGTSNEAVEEGKAIATSGETDKSKNGDKYVVHPAFQNGSSTGFQNGEWDEEIPGFWMAKFEAGYVGEANKIETAKQTNIVYTTIKGTTADNVSSNNYYYYGTRTSETKMTYPTFQANRPSYNNISISDAFILCRNLTANGNPYHLQKVDSHLMKNSEWGAVAYLAWSQYGRNGTEITINNVSANGTNTIYAVTGYGGASVSTGTATNTDLSTLLKGNPSETWSTSNTAGNWTTTQGKSASTTGNITGVYDMSGGAWERTAGLVSNGNSNLLTYGKALLDNTKVSYTESETKKVTENTGNSTKYVTIYPHDTEYDKNGTSGITEDTASQKNFTKNTSIYGDAIRETTGSKVGTNDSGWNTNAWNSNFSYFPGYTSPFAICGARWSGTTHAGAFAFSREAGDSDYNSGFRAVLIPNNSVW